MSERTDATGTSDGAAEATTTPPTPSRPRPTLRELMRRYPWVAATITAATWSPSSSPAPSAIQYARRFLT